MKRMKALSKLLLAMTARKLINLWWIEIEAQTGLAISCGILASELLI